MTRSSLQACTIVTRSHIAHARVVAASFLEHHPEAEFTVVVVDDVDRLLDRGEPGLSIVDPVAIGVDQREHLRQAAMYEPLGLVSASHAPALRYLLDRGASAAVYLDADIQIFGRLDEAVEHAERGDVVLTPHETEPGPPDHYKWYLLGGVYNGGFLALGQANRRFLDWLEARVARDCVAAPGEGYAYGQRWLEFVPALFDHYVVRTPGWNVMGWNLGRRDVHWNGARYLVDGEPLCFFHFCGGLDPRAPDRLTSHPELPWYRQPVRGALARLCREYAERLLAAGYAEAMAMPYGYSTLSDGTPLDAVSRSAYRLALIEAEGSGLPEPPNPFLPDEEGAFLSCLAEPCDPAEPRLSRYLLGLWRRRSDLRAAFPAVPGRDTPRYLDWVEGEPANAVMIPARFQISPALQG